MQLICPVNETLGHWISLDGLLLNVSDLMACDNGLSLCIEALTYYVMIT